MKCRMKQNELLKSRNIFKITFINYWKRKNLLKDGDVNISPQIFSSRN